MLHPQDAICQIHWIIEHSPRLKELLHILHIEGASTQQDLKRRFLISHWPVVCWMIEMVVRRIGVKSVSITAAKTSEERAQTATEFNNVNSEC